MLDEFSSTGLDLFLGPSLEEEVKRWHFLSLNASRLGQDRLKQEAGTSIVEG
jgi:hypothetical protein